MRDRIERTVEWYKWLLRFHPLKYIGIFIMAAGPLFLIYRFLFIGSSQTELILGSIGAIVMGSFIWSLGWDPYA